jgi:parallel beta-helix repeat protein
MILKRVWLIKCKTKHVFRATLVLAPLFGILALAGVAESKTWHVRQDGTGDTEYIHTAQSYAQAGDTILVGPGLYLQSPIRLSAVHLISESGPKSTILQLTAYSDEDVHVIYIEGISGCSIVGFTIRGGASGWLNTGGGIDCINSDVLIKQNIINGNWCASGGGIACYGSPAPAIEGNLIFGNSAFSGAAILVDNSSPTISNNTIVDNYASILGGSIYVLGSASYPTISNNIASNSSVQWGGMMSDIPSSQIVFACNDVWNNVPSNYCDSLVDQTGIHGNISADPLFCGVVGSGNYYLQASSPCVEGHAPAYCGGVLMGCYPAKCTVGVKKDSWGDIKSLFK